MNSTNKKKFHIMLVAAIVTVVIVLLVILVSPFHLIMRDVAKKTSAEVKQDQVSSQATPTFTTIMICKVDYHKRKVGYREPNVGTWEDLAPKKKFEEVVEVLNGNCNCRHKQKGKCEVFICP